MTEYVSRELTSAADGIRGVLVWPGRNWPAGRPGVVVLSGSSGRIESARARLIASQGASVLALGYFGGPGEPAGICLVPLETVIRAVELLREAGCRPIGLVGTSKGAEAALVVATLDDRIDAVVGISPSSVVWANIGAGADGVEFPLRSSWSWGGHGLPFVPYDPDWRPATSTEPPAYRELYLSSLARYAEAAATAAIDLNRTRAHILLVAGGDDQVWPSGRFARDLASTRPTGDVLVVEHRDAGHRVVLPGEVPADGGVAMARGGTPAADAELGAAAWRLMAPTLQLG